MTYKWVDYYTEFATKLLEFKYDRAGLISLLRKVYDEKGIKFPKLESEGIPKDIDPFTVFALFNKGITYENRTAILTGISEYFGVEADVPDDYSGVPVVNNMMATFYAFEDNPKRQKDDINNLWSVFESALSLADNEDAECRDAFIIAYNNVLDQFGVRWNLTMGLYWIRPHRFINLDSLNRAFLADKNNLSDDVAGVVSSLKNVPDAETYLDLCRMCKEELASGKYTFSTFPELSYEAWNDAADGNDNIDVSEWMDADYSPGLTVDEWVDLIKDDSLFTPNCLKVMKRIKDYGGQATCKQLSLKYGGSYNFYNSVSSTLAEKIVKRGHCQAPSLRENGKSRWWPVLYIGKGAAKEDEGSFIWKLRIELSDALDKVDLSGVQLYENEKPVQEPQEPHNYWWLVASPKIWSFSSIRIGEEQSYTLYNENGNKRRIFQNFLDAKPGDLVIGYEANPVKKVVALGCITKGSNGKEIYFEKTESLTTPIEYKTLKEAPELADMEFFTQLNGSLFKLTEGEYDLLMDMIREENPVRQNVQLDKYNKEDFLSDVFMSEDDYDMLRELLTNKKNVILNGPPGVGKTFSAKRLAYSMLGEKDDSRIEMVQFHQNYSYEDFVMGYRPDGAGFKLAEGVFYQFCQRANNDPEKDYFFIIDEINRGNLSKIFGELLMLIEKEYRGTEVTMAYNGLRFHVPENLYIIGMMNTADRSIAIIDYALRRRFSFFDMSPGFDTEGFRAYQKALDSDTFDAVVEQIKELNKEIKLDRSLGDGFMIGHSYFCGREEKGYSDIWMRSVINYDIIPTLKEYWFDDQEKVKHWSKELRGSIDD